MYSFTKTTEWRNVLPFQLLTLYFNELERGQTAQLLIHTWHLVCPTSVKYLMALSVEQWRLGACSGAGILQMHPCFAVTRLGGCSESLLSSEERSCMLWSLAVLSVKWRFKPCVVVHSYNPWILKVDAVRLRRDQVIFGFVRELETRLKHRKPHLKTHK